jgi:hypothetical protein
MSLKSLIHGLDIGFRHAKAEAPEMLEFANPARKEFYLSVLLLALPLAYYGIKLDNSSNQTGQINYSPCNETKK